MVIFWRGWGILVLFAPLIWMVALLMVMVFSGYHEPDPERAAATLYRMGAAGLALATINLWLVVCYRERVAPGVDQFIFVPMKHWIYVIGFCATAAFVASFFHPSI